jgi:DNA polymerase III epsilon subunit family exonuclease
MRPSLRGLDVAVVDVETTGLFPSRNDRIIEISVVRTRLGTGEQRAFSTLVNPNRDVGPTRIHGIRSKDLLGAPTFDEVAGDVFELLSGAVLAGHNVTFDKAFLTSEFGRLGESGTLGKPLCTMRLGRELDIDSEGRSLADYCACLGISLAQAHTAEHDAAATTSLLQAFVSLAEQKKIRALEDLDFEVAPVDPRGWPSLPTSGRVHRRDVAATTRSPQSYLAQLVHRLGPSAATAHSPQMTSYFALLDRVLEDNIVTDAEAEGLLELAEMSGLSSSAVRDAHRRYLEALAAAALKDSVVTDSERRELESVASLLGFEVRAVDDALAEAPKVTPRPLLPLGSNGSQLAGKTVCFTGELLGSLEATPISRKMAEDLASQAGLKPMKSVTKKLDILVVADPHTMSGKGRKAREYGTRIMAEQAFWRAIGVEVE